eukprot:CAMPEP_0172187494 /NCGR_PEP_ID=MMETSP1050-20130122/21376_1 /TAXON_ID=233186 /ORGANISM="Cryptomonas curvata, Strain CCAP979/52" /LENGTH=75 /DNA_ID=CAMNT_0012861837 /DNA_START=86 /DNA_END=313 /DNA_ORIENTATION=+
MGAVEVGVGQVAVAVLGALVVVREGMAVNGAVEESIIRSLSSRVKLIVAKDASQNTEHICETNGLHNHKQTFNST